MQPPLIGITCSRYIGGAWSQYSPGHYLDYTFNQYSRAVASDGGVPVLIPVAQTPATVAELTARLDGVLFSGGPDIHPRRYGQQPSRGLGDIDDDLDEMELQLARAAIESDVPVLGICRGIQLLNVSLGGTLIQDIASETEAPINHTQKAAKTVNSHTVEIVRDSLLARIVKQRRIWVNSRHHQAVGTPAGGLTVAARAPDGIIEAVELPAGRFFLAVQWHPEGTWDRDRFSKALFRAFVAAAADQIP